MTLGLFFMILALVLFLVAVFEVPARFNLVAAGLASLTAALLFGSVALG